MFSWLKIFNIIERNLYICVVRYFLFMNLLMKELVKKDLWCFLIWDLDLL